MKRDVQVGVTLGVIILAIIGVFLSTRTTVQEPAIPIPEGEEEAQIDALNISDLPQDPQTASQESFQGATTALQGTNQKALAITGTEKIDVQPAEKEDNIVEGEWKKAQEQKSVESGNVAVNDTESSAISNADDWKDVPSGDLKKTPSKGRIHKVQNNDNLRKIARKYYGDESRWLLIFNANQDKIQDRNSLRIGTELIIPEEKATVQKIKAEIKTEVATPPLSRIVEQVDTKPSMRNHVVQQGDSLYTLAVKYYGDGAKWNKIFDANRKILKDQKSLKIGQELVIPDL